jgi:hypothetical protein
VFFDDLVLLVPLRLDADLVLLVPLRLRNLLNLIFLNFISKSVKKPAMLKNAYFVLNDYING